MPYKTDKLKLDCPFLDRRVKLIPCQVEMVKHWYKKGESINGISRLFKVNKRLIQFILFPERKKKNLQDREARGGTMQYYNREEHNDSMKDHRRYKHKTLSKINTL